MWTQSKLWDTLRPLFHFLLLSTYWRRNILGSISSFLEGLVWQTCCNIKEKRIWVISYSDISDTFLSITYNRSDSCIAGCYSKYRNTIRSLREFQGVMLCNFKCTGCPCSSIRFLHPENPTGLNLTGLSGWRASTQCNPGHCSELRLIYFKVIVILFIQTHTSVASWHCELSIKKYYLCFLDPPILKAASSQFFSVSMKLTGSHFFVPLVSAGLSFIVVFSLEAKWSNRGKSNDFWPEWFTTCCLEQSVPFHWIMNYYSRTCVTFQQQWWIKHTGGLCV